MKTVILSPHVDDAIFSLGNYIQQLDDVTILSVFSGIPNDVFGFEKHIKLRKEHERACKVLGADYINGDFFDDVYTPRPTEKEITTWLDRYIHGFDIIICPLGIKHPDHIYLRSIVQKNYVPEMYYAELPYRVLYPDEKDLLVHHLGLTNRTKVYQGVSMLKQKAVECYQSQLQNDHVLDEIMSTEELYD